MSKYLNFNFDWQILSHESNVDCNSRRFKQHLSAVICGGGSTSENIIIDFVNGTVDSIKHYKSVNEAWLRLDAEQQDYVFELRNIVGAPYLGEKQWFPVLFLKQVVRDRYYQKELAKEEELGCELVELDNKIEIQVELAENSIREVESETGFTLDNVYSVVEDDD